MLIVGEGQAGKTTLAHKIENPDCSFPDIDDRTRGITINPHEFTTKAKNSQENEIFINRKNNQYIEKGIFLKLVLW